jgi:hypothetical protein
MSSPLCWSSCGRPFNTSISTSPLCQSEAATPGEVEKALTTASQQLHAVIE